MVKYRYSKYSVTTTTEYRNLVLDTSSSKTTTLVAEKPLYSTWETEREYYTDIKLDPNKGIVGTGTSVKRKNGENPAIGRYAITSSTKAFKILSSTFKSGGKTYYYTDEYSCSRSTTYSRGSLISYIIAEEGIYPNNGRHSDGYWYVKREVANTDPILQVNQLDTELFEGSKLILSGTVLDTDIDDAVTVRYKVNSFSTRNIKAYISDGNEEGFTKVLTYSKGNLYDGTTMIASDLKDGKHTITVWAEDSNGGKSEEEIIVVRTKRNRPPELLIEDYPTGIQGLFTTDLLQVAGSVSDPDDGALLTVTAQINNDEPQTIPIEDGEWSFSFAVKRLNEGDNILTFEVADQYGATDKQQVKLTNTVHASPAPISVARYKLDTPEPITDLIMWIKHKADADIKVYASIVQEGEPDNYVEMTKVEGMSPTGVLESEFTYSTEVAATHVKVKIVNADQAMMIMGGMSNSKVGGV